MDVKVHPDNITKEKKVMVAALVFDSKTVTNSIRN